MIRRITLTLMSSMMCCCLTSGAYATDTDNDGLTDAYEGGWGYVRCSLLYQHRLLI